MMEAKYTNTLPMSVQPRPVMDPRPAMTTTYATNHNAKLKASDNFFRSRTFNDATADHRPEVGGHDYNRDDGRGIYPSHGAGKYNLPYYRRDSHGFRRPYTQPVGVDMHYMQMQEHKQQTQALDNGQSTYAHPSSFPNYPADSMDNFVATNSRPSSRGPMQFNDPNVEYSKTILGDPLLNDPLLNARRKNRTTYKRAFGQCR